MIIGINAWEPALTKGEKSSAAGAFWLRKLIDFYIKNGHEVVWLEDKEGVPEGTQRMVQGQNLDVAIFCWRWLFHDDKYKSRNELYWRQMQLLYNLAGQCRIIVHDQDHKISDGDMQFLIDAQKYHDIVITAPELFPREGFESLMYPAFFDVEFSPMPYDKIHSMTYVGNNYERYDQAVKFLSDVEGVMFIGNWLDASPLRESPLKVLKDFPNAEFLGRQHHGYAMSVMRNSAATIMLSKDSYEETGFCTIRWFESVAADVPMLIPDSFRLPDKWGRLFSTASMRVENSNDVRLCIWVMNNFPLMRQNAIKLMKQFCEEEMNPQNWLDILEVE